MHAVRKSLSAGGTPAILVTLMTLVAACGGAPVTDEGPMATPSAEAQVPAATDGPPPAVTLDFSAKPALAGHVLLRGSCAGFRFDLQHPVDWEVSGGPLGLAKQRNGGGDFGIRQGDDLGSTHVASQLERLKREGARLAGEVLVGGQRVEVLSPQEGTYHLFAPHPWGTSAVMYYWLIVSSSVGDEATLRILNTLVPVDGC